MAKTKTWVNGAWLEDSEFTAAEYVIVHAHSGSCFAGFLASDHDRSPVVLEDARQLLEASCRALPGLAYEGPIGDSPPLMTPVVERIVLFCPVEVITCTAEARDKILNCPNEDFSFDFETKMVHPKGEACAKLKR